MKMALFAGSFLRLASRVVSNSVTQAGPAVSSLIGFTRSFGLSSALANVRCHFPRPSEIKRIKRHGLKTRLSTVNGRKVLMNRILKGRHVLSH